MGQEISWRTHTGMRSYGRQFALSILPISSPIHWHGRKRPTIVYVWLSIICIYDDACEFRLPSRVFWDWNHWAMGSGTRDDTAKGAPIDNPHTSAGFYTTYRTHWAASSTRLESYGFHKCIRDCVMLVRNSTPIIRRRACYVEAEVEALVIESTAITPSGPPIATQFSHCLPSCVDNNV